MEGGSDKNIVIINSIKRFWSRNEFTSHVL
jgi:hypothetical protein